MGNIVYIATSLDGFIADRDGALDWLQSIPNPDNVDLGFGALMNRIDGIVMGRNTFESIAAMDVMWPYPKPVFVLSRTLRTLPEGFEGKAELTQGTPQEITERLGAEGYNELYIDGGKTVQSFLREDLIDEMIITRLPILLGGGTPLFGELPRRMMFELISSAVALDSMVMSHYRLKR